MFDWVLNKPLDYILFSVIVKLVHISIFRRQFHSIRDILNSAFLLFSPNFNRCFPWTHYMLFSDLHLQRSLRKNSNLHIGHAASFYYNISLLKTFKMLRALNHPMIMLVNSIGLCNKHSRAQKHAESNLN